MGFTLTYNSRNLVSQITNGRNQTTSLDYDDAGKLDTITDAVGTISYGYDNNDNLLTITDASGTITRTYDSLNRLKTYKDVNNKLIGYEYDKVGNLKTIIYPDNKTVSYQYTDANQLYKVTDWASRVTQYDYDDNGRLETVIRPNGTVLILTYDDKGQLETMIDQDASLNVINAYVLTYDKEGNVTVEDRTGGETYTIDNNFDAIYRLTTQKETINSVTNEQYDYTYDAGGNIKTIQTTTGTMQVQVYGDANHLSTVDGQTIVHDADGNMTSGPLSGSQTNFTFDARNRLTSAGTSSYVYNAENQRTSITENGKTTNYVIDPNAALSRALTKTENGVTTYYVYGLGLIGEETNSTYSTYHYDLRGSTIALTNTSGTVTDTFNYGPYGELENHTGTTDIDYLYNGRDGVITDDNGLYYMRARYYNPEIKRFLSEDQFAGKYNDILNVNLYGYVGGNPIGFVDPSGNDGVGLFSGFEDEYNLVSQFIEPEGLYGIGINEAGSIGLGGTTSIVLITDGRGNYAIYEVIGADIGIQGGYDSTISLIFCDDTNDPIAFNGYSRKIVDISGGELVVGGGSISVSKTSNNEILKWLELRVGLGYGFAGNFSTGDAEATMMKSKIDGEVTYGEGYEPDDKVNYLNDDRWD